MPMFEYRCNACGKTEERLQKSDAPESHPCDCEKLGILERQLSAPHFNLKGTGWYSPGFSGGH